MKFSTDGLIIKTNDIGENDRSVVVLTRDRGLVNAFVSSARKPGGKNTAATALLTYSHFSFTEKGETCRITESETLKVFFDLRADIEKYSLAQYLCELLRVIVPYGAEEEDYLRIALNSLYFLDSGKKDIYTVKAVTEMRLMAVSGFTPDLIGCNNCGTDQTFPLYLDAEGGEMLCAECFKKVKTSINTLELDRTTLAALRHIVYSEFDKLYAFSIPDTHKKYLSLVTERFLTRQTDHRFKTLDFFHSIETQI